MSIDPSFELEKELKDCQAILRYLSTYPDVLQKMEINQLLKPEEVHQQLRSWKHVVSQYEGLEKEFYRDYWLPIEFDNFQFFIDLSKPEYPVIETIYLMGEKNSDEYISSILFESAEQFLLLIENQNELSRYFERHLMLKYFNYMDIVDFESNPFDDSQE